MAGLWMELRLGLRLSISLGLRLSLRLLPAGAEAQAQAQAEAEAQPQPQPLPQPSLSRSFECFWGFLLHASSFCLFPGNLVIRFLLSFFPPRSYDLFFGFHESVLKKVRMELAKRVHYFFLRTNLFVKPLRIIIAPNQCNMEIIIYFTNTNK